MKKAETAKKPSSLAIDNVSRVDVFNDGLAEIQAGRDSGRVLMTAKEARRLSSWLTRFADWSDSKTRRTK